MLFLGFHALDLQAHAQAARQTDDGVDDGGALFVFSQVRHETTVDLDLGNGKLTQVTQGRVTGTKIIQGERQPEFLHAFDVSQGTGGGVQHQALGDFQFHAVVRQPVGIEQGRDPVGKQGISELPRRQVDRDEQVGGLVAPLAKPFTNLVHHPETELLDQSAFLGDGNELHGGHMPQFPGIPAQQGFRPQQCPARHVMDRLKKDFQLAGIQRLAQMGFHKKTSAQALPHGWLPQEISVLAVGLGLIHGGVRRTDQVTEMGCVIRCQGNADGGADKQVIPFYPEGCGEDCDHFLGDGRDVADLVEVLDHHGELVAAETANNIITANSLAQARGRLVQQFVTCLVTKGVVGRLEVVQVDEHQRQPAARSADLRQGIIDVFVEELPVGKLGQRVGMGQPVKLLFRALALVQLHTEGFVM